MDFIRFTTENGVSSSAICGDYAATDGYSDDLTKYAIDERGRLKIDIELDPFEPLEHIKDTLDIAIVVTAFITGLPRAPKLLPTIVVLSFVLVFDCRL